MPKLGLKVNPALHGRLKLARLLEMPEQEFESRLKTLQDKPIFRRLRELGVISLANKIGTRFSSKRFAGWNLHSDGNGAIELLNGNDDLIQIIQRMGQEKFQEYFLSDTAYSDEKKKRACDISIQEALKLKELINRLYIRAEFETPPPGESSPSQKVFSAIAGIDLENGRPVISFFNRDIWQGQFHINEKQLRLMKPSLSDQESRQLNQILNELKVIEKRKTALYKTLEILIQRQAKYLITGEPENREPFSQRRLAASLEIEPSALNRLISNKSIQLPWGLEAPIKVLLPSRKTLLKERLYELAASNPSLSDEKLKLLLEKRGGAKLSRRSIAQYRTELGVGGRGRRG